jgi:hypothetical protein
MQIQRLNLDNSWYLGLNGLRLLVDPWLEGVEVDFFPWFNTQWHRTAPLPCEQAPESDLVLITQKYADHFHPQTLSRLKPGRVVAPASIEKRLRKLLPAAEIVALDARRPVFETRGVRIELHPNGKALGPEYNAFSICDDREAVFLAPHGYFAGRNWLPPSRPVMLLISTFNHFKLPFFLGGTIAPGIRGLLHLAEKLDPAHIVATHDEDKHAKGLVMKLARVQRIGSSDLEALPALQGRVLELEDYQVVQL